MVRPVGGSVAARVNDADRGAGSAAVERSLAATVEGALTATAVELMSGDAVARGVVAAGCGAAAVSGESVERRRAGCGETSTVGGVVAATSSATELRWRSDSVLARRAGLLATRAGAGSGWDAAGLRVGLTSVAAVARSGLVVARVWRFGTETGVWAMVGRESVRS
jgi:hypothetical protein